MSAARRGDTPTVRLVGGGVLPLQTPPVPPDPARVVARPPLVAAPCLALVLGPSVGVALRWDRARVGSGVESFESRPGESPGQVGQRFRTFVRELLDLAGPGLVVYAPTSSDVELGQPDARVCLGQEALLLAELEGRTNHVAARRPGEAWTAAVQAHWRRSPKSPKEAEALGLLAWALDAIGEELTP